MGSKESAEPLQHPPEADEDAAAARHRRKLRIAAGVSVMALAVVSFGLTYLQNHVTGPKPISVQPPSLPSLYSLAKEKGFPVECLTFAYDPITGGEEPVADKIACSYTGHPAGQPDPEKPCEMTLERIENDPYSFRVVTTGTDGSTIFLGKSPLFTEAAATPGLPVACLPENMTY